MDLETVSELLHWAEDMIIFSFFFYIFRKCIMEKGQSQLKYTSIGTSAATKNSISSDFINAICVMGATAPVNDGKNSYSTISESVEWYTFFC